MKICFKQVTSEQLDIVFGWLAQEFVAEFWDNTQAHKDDIINFVQGRKTPSAYAGGKYVYWIASADALDGTSGKQSEDEPFALLMTIQETPKDNIGREKLRYLSKTGNTYGLDYMIGNPNFFGKGYGARSLSEFIDYFRANVDPKADTFLIDPISDNPRAKHVFMKAGFEPVCDFRMEGEYSGTGKLHHLLVKKFEPRINIIYEAANPGG